ncbi:hypothetical protein M899_1003 [Bacteriovorax sp. BSW11_IV]|uniref:hypothetical protein n=1 Tax=Bacteriovorax sp. BSW11_IV TaxID=1353529 RepID=UPI000389FBA8|nr:hypothetical protein [Bacteriovorax sp. BSW11_IV]EQC48661.1 hypothetical protein M899_1003 [Bacteriovorax sp. BSW11_IV]
MKTIVILMTVIFNLSTFASSSKLTKRRMEFLQKNFPHITKIFGAYKGIPMVPYQPKGEEDTCILNIYPVVLFDDDKLIEFTVQISYLDSKNQYKEVVFDNGISYGRFLSDRYEYIKSISEGGIAQFQLLSAPLNAWFGIKPTVIRFEFEEAQKLSEFYISKKPIFGAKTDPYNKDMGCTEMEKVSDNWN